MDSAAARSRPQRPRRGPPTQAIRRWQGRGCVGPGRRELPTRARSLAGVRAGPLESVAAHSSCAVVAIEEGGHTVSVNGLAHASRRAQLSLGCGLRPQHTEAFSQLTTGRNTSPETSSRWTCRRQHPGFGKMMNVPQSPPK